MVTRIAIMALRICALAAIMLGVLFWTENALQLREVHMTLGILVVLALWVVAFAGGVGTPARTALAAGAVALGALLALVGMTQERLLPGAQHWIIQVVHLGLALVAVTLGELIARRTPRTVRVARVTVR